MILCGLCGLGEPLVVFDGVMYQCKCSSCYDPADDGGERSAARGVGETEWDAVQDWVRVCDELLEEDEPAIEINPIFAQLERQLAEEHEQAPIELTVAGLPFQTARYAYLAAGWTTDEAAP